MADTHAHPNAQVGDAARMPSAAPNAATAIQAETSIDPVCGMTVTIKPDGRKAEYGGTTFHFCSNKCKTKFGLDPYFYASGNSLRRGKVVKAGASYTCPMHPQITRDAPGNCPVCGMAL